MEHMKHIQVNTPNSDSPAQPMKGNQPLMKGEQLLMKGDQVLSLNLLHLGGQEWGGHLPGDQFPHLPNSSNR